jgi:hypothetical protein
MSETNETTLIQELRDTLLKQRRQITDLTRHNKELREAIDALLQPAPSELLAKNMAHPSRQK